jgi:hypothetical protein
MIDAARMHLLGFDGLRWLGADPSSAADPIERVLAVKLANRVTAEQEGAHG